MSFPKDFTQDSLLQFRGRVFFQDQQPLADFLEMLLLLYLEAINQLSPDSFA
jgi:hypothetical protein